MNSQSALKRFSALLTGVVFILLADLVQAQLHQNLFRQRPIPTSPGPHGVLAQLGDVDEAALEAGPTGLTIVVPGKPDLTFDRQTHEPRGPRSILWRGRNSSDHSNATLTLHDV